MSAMSSRDVTINSDGRRRGLFGNIRTRLIVSFSFAFVAVLIAVESVGLFGIPFTDETGRQGHEKSRAFQSLNLVADLKKERLQGWLEERRGDAHVASDSDMVEANVTVLRAATNRLVGGGQESDLWGRVRKERSYLALREFLDVISTSYGVYQRLFIADAETGIIFVSTDKAYLGSDLSGHSCFTGVLRSRYDYVSDIELDPESNRPFFRIAHVIEDIDVDTLEDKEGQVIAVLVLEVDADEILGPILRCADGLGMTGEALLINEDVRIVASLKHPLADGTRAMPLEHHIKAAPAVLAAGGQEGIIESQDYRGEQVLAAYRYIPVTPEWGWGMVVKRDLAELFAPMRREIVQSVAIGLAGILVVVGLTVLMARTLTRPILALSRTAKQVSDGDLTARAPVTGSDEVGALATMFNSMVARVQNWRRELEENVRLRTAELDTANEGLKTEIVQRKQAEQERESLIGLLEESNATLDHMNGQLTRSNSELQEFAYVASHDLQEPLRKVQAFGERLKVKYEGALDDRGNDYISRMQNAAERMQALINDLLSFSRVSSKAQPFTRVELGKVAEGVLSDLETRIEELDARVEVDDLPIIDADRLQMRQLLQNLIGNALKFHRRDEPPVVKVRGNLLDSGGQQSDGLPLGTQLCQIKVEDNGVGFEQKHAERIFGFFQRLHGRSAYRGTGIGLAICRKIVDRHGGRIIAESSPGQGARFIVTLPVKQPKGEPEQCQTSDSQSRS